MDHNFTEQLWLCEDHKTGTKHKDYLLNMYESQSI